MTAAYAADDGSGLAVQVDAGGSTVRLLDLVPGSTRSGTATVTTTDVTQVHLWATAETSVTGDGLQVSVELCRTSWQDEVCPTGALAVPLDGTTLDAGTMRPDENWQVRIVATLPLDAGNATRSSSTSATVRLSTSGESGEGGTDGDVLALTGADALAVLVAVGLVIIGAVVRRLAAHLARRALGR
ncbi:MAG TPA: hypothetical protein VGC67_08735 [Cellulomonas sp.]